MSTSYTGGCACGGVRYEIAAEPIVMVDCQCRQCQRLTGGGHGSYMTFSGGDPKIEGEPRTYETVGDGGTVKSCGFCPTCGSPLFISFPAMPGILAVHAGSLDDPGRYKPAFATWHASAHAWDRLDPDLQVFDRMPPA